MRNLGTDAKLQSDRKGQDVHVDLMAVVVAITEASPLILTAGQWDKLPAGPFELSHRSLQSGLRVWVEQQTGHELGYLEQLYTFADRDRVGVGRLQRNISISYLGLTRKEEQAEFSKRYWKSWYDYFPWEDHRLGKPKALDALQVRLTEWANSADVPARQERHHRVAMAFALDNRDWNEELVLQRYELLFEAGLVEEAAGASKSTPPAAVSGKAMIGDHRRILATGIARLRSKIKYRPVAFELLQPTFTLLHLQRAVEGLAGRLLDKPNFRRLVEQQELVEETGETSVDTGGRPAKLYRFRQAALDDRVVAGTKLPLARA